MAKQVFIQQSYTGGQAAGSKIGYKNSYNDGIGIDFRSDPDKLTSLQKLTKESGTVVTGAIKWMAEYEGFYFAYEDMGAGSSKLHRRSTTNEWSNMSTIVLSAAQGLEIFNTLNDDALWYAGNTRLGRAINLTGVMTFDDNYIVTIAQDIDQSAVTSGNTYTTPTAISETSTNRKTFIPGKIMLTQIDVLVSAKGTGNWTLTLHDSNNVTVGTATLSNSSIANASYNGFIFNPGNDPLPLELVPGASYHFHLTSTVADGTVTTSSLNNLETVTYRTKYPPLVIDSDFHPMKVFQGSLLIGNSRFVATLDDSEVYDPERLVFPKGEKVRCMESIGSYVAIATWRGSNIDDYGTSRIYFWDGVSPTYNDFIDIDGQVNAMKNTGNNKLIIIHGSEGNITIYTGGITYKRKLKDVGRNKTVEVYPGAITVWEKILYFGISDGDSEVDRVCYAYGTKDNDYPNALSKDYVISTGNYGFTSDEFSVTGVTITCIFGVSADKFFVCWKDTTTGTAVYGIDVISTTAQQEVTFVDTLRLDGGMPNRKKKSTVVTVNCEPLNPGQKIQVYYRLDHGQQGFQFLGELSYDRDREVVYKSFPFNKDWYEAELRVKLLANEEYEAPSLLALGMDMDGKDEVQAPTLQAK